MQNKKVLLRERKRHTACRVVSTHSVVLSWLTPLPATGLSAPPPATGLPPPGYWPDPPRYWPDRPPLPHWTDLTPPPPPPWTDRIMMDGQTRVKTLPSRCTTYAGGNNTTITVRK